MSQVIQFPEPLKIQLQKIATQRRYPLVLEILQRGQDEELIVNSQEEVQALVNVARIEMLDAALKYPFWDEDSPRYEAQHENAFQDVQMGIFEKTIMYLSQAYQVVTMV